MKVFTSSPKWLKLPILQNSDRICYRIRTDIPVSRECFPLHCIAPNSNPSVSPASSPAHQPPPECLLSESNRSLQVYAWYAVHYKSKRLSLLLGVEPRYPAHETSTLTVVLKEKGTSPPNRTGIQESEVPDAHPLHQRGKGEAPVEYLMISEIKNL